ncbi:hypothetical protein [Periweissella fabalis]|uniref:Uncharacterized protein n=1 Tax=Periweissella fabalis TaxID=1070421 RepID=A0A7X6N1I6_9LACO|nr:hypothetical protein [Periweissella fabalis]MCM0599884.1 hypothetical protein [Periweissella fabalis]NKZ24061.1 hypothetical protein [Periweissella fabalis]
MRKRRNIFLLILVAILFIVVTIAILASVKDNKGIPQNGLLALNIFFGIQTNGFDLGVTSMFFIFTIVQLCGSLMHIYIKNSNYLIMVQQRIGYRHFVKQGIICTFAVTVGLSLLINLYEVGVISLLVHPFTSTSMPIQNRFATFNNGTVTGVIIYSALSVIGLGIYSVLIFIIGLFIKKTILYIPLSAILSIVLSVMPIVILKPLGAGPVAALIAYILTPLGLYSPNQAVYMPIFQLSWFNNYIAFMVTGVIYLTITWLLAQIWIKRKEKLG